MSRSARPFRPARRKAGSSRDQKGGSSPLSRGQLVDVHIDKLSHDGRGIARYQQRTGFVGGALPGEHHRVRISECRSRYWQGESLQLLGEASPQRQNPPCPYYGDCGGCDLQHLSEGAQLAAKERAVLDRLQRWAGIEPEELAPALSAQGLGYRLRARLGVQCRKGQCTIGFRQSSSETLVDIAGCLVLSPPLDALLQGLRSTLPRLEKPFLISHLWLVSGDGDCGAVLRHKGRFSPEDCQQLQALAGPGRQLWLQGDKGGELYSLNGEAVDPRLRFSHPQSGVTLQFHPLDFIQANGELNRMMVSQALDWLSPQPHERLLDLFCGVGNFALPLARRCRELVGVEGSEAMTQRSAANAEQNGIKNCRFMAADLSQSHWYRGLPWDRVDGVLLDPPRAGAATVVEQLGKLKPRRVLYVSCDPATLARDAAALEAQGYRLQRLGVMDIFPQTAHIETMALFVISPSRGNKK